MAWIRRFGTLVRADAHGVLDVLEDRALLLRQHLREAREAVEAKRCRLAALEVEDRDTAAENGRVVGRLTALERDIDLALAEERDDLARYSIKKLLPLRQARDRLGRRRAALGEERQRLTEQLAEQEQALSDLEARVKAHLAHRGLVGGLEGGFCDEAVVVTDDDVEIELLRRRVGEPASAEPPSGETVGGVS